MTGKRFSTRLRKQDPAVCSTQETYLNPGYKSSRMEVFQADANRRAGVTALTEDKGDIKPTGQRLTLFNGKHHDSR